MDCSDGEVSLPLTITYAEWKEQQKRWLPNYEVTKPLLPVKKAKKKKKSGLQWPQAARSEKNDVAMRLRKKKKAKTQDNAEVKTNKRYANNIVIVNFIEC